MGDFAASIPNKYKQQFLVLSCESERRPASKNVTENRLNNSFSHYGSNRTLSKHLLNRVSKSPFSSLSNHKHVDNCIIKEKCELTNM